MSASAVLQADGYLAAEACVTRRTDFVATARTGANAVSTLKENCVNSDRTPCFAAVLFLETVQ